MATAAVPSLSATEIEVESDDVFKRFDIVSDHSDHAYFNPKAKAPSSALQKIITKEWRKLEEHLPDSIFVRVYENRIDLMRAAIVGAAGTPYHDGLFIFDIKFPPDYPQRPPSVHYRSFGARINPNLYNTGYVCLSLLNTWTGKKKSERWDPQNSTMLQVLVSIQGLVLNEEPYYNEPWMLPSRSHRKKSREYTEGVFVLSCKTMTWVMNKPPKGFEALVAAYFRGKGSRVLAACGAYVGGRVQVGYHGVRAAADPGTYRISATFKESVKSVYPILLALFQKSGAHVADFPRQLAVEHVAMPKGKKTKKPVTENKEGQGEGGPAEKGSLSRIFGILKKIVGLKDTSKKKNKEKNVKSQSSQVTPN